MSYDLMVFDPERAPQARAEFLEWYKKQFEGDKYEWFDDLDITTPSLRAWFFEMIKDYPALNGPYASDPLVVDENRLADYCIGEAVIYISFGWPQMEDAYETTFKLAHKHNLGFFNASSSDGDVWLPNKKGILEIAHSN